MKVVLGGDGADELLAGYPTFAAERAAGLFRRLPRPAQSLAEAAVGRLPVDHGNFSFDFKLKQFLRGAAEPLPLAHQRWLGSFSGPELVAPAGRAGDARIDVEAEHLALAGALAPWRRPADPLAGALPGDVPARGHPDQGRPGQHGLRARGPGAVPRRGAGRRRSSGCPPSFKYGRKQTKRLLKAAVSGRLPASILNRPKKGFGIPVARWLRGPLAPLLDRLLEPATARAAGTVPPRRGRPAHRRASVGRPRPSQAALDAPDVPALVRYGGWR